MITTETFGRFKPLNIVQQVNMIPQLFNGVRFPNHNLFVGIQNREIKLPESADGWLAIPNWPKIEKVFGKTYNTAFSVVETSIEKVFRGVFEKYCTDYQLDERHLRQMDRKRDFLEKISEEQRNPDILIFPVNFGSRYSDSVLENRESVSETSNEFLLGGFELGVALLTHLNLSKINYLLVDCGGDEVDVEIGDPFDHTLHFSLDDGVVVLDSYPADIVATGVCGSPSGFKI